MPDLKSFLDSLKVSDNARADAWDAFHDSPDQGTFKKRLDATGLPDNAKADLWDLKYPAPVDIKPTETVNELNPAMAFAGSKLGMALLSGFQKKVNDPLDKMGQVGGQVLGEVATSQAGQKLASAKAAGARFDYRTRTGPEPTPVKPMNPTEEGIARAVGEFTGSMVADPRQLALMGGAFSSAVARKLMGGGFAGLMAYNTHKTAGELGAVIDDPNVPQAEKSRVATHLALSAVMTGLAAHSVATPNKAPVSPEQFNESVRAMIQKSSNPKAPAIAKMLQDSGGSFLGIDDHPITMEATGGDPLVFFNDAQLRTKSTMALKLSELSPENIAKKIDLFVQRDSPPSAAKAAAAAASAQQMSPPGAVPAVATSVLPVPEAQTPTAVAQAQPPKKPYLGPTRVGKAEPAKPEAESALEAARRGAPGEPPKIENAVPPAERASEAIVEAKRQEGARVDKRAEAKEGIPAKEEVLPAELPPPRFSTEVNKLSTLPLEKHISEIVRYKQTMYARQKSYRTATMNEDVYLDMLQDATEGLAQRHPQAYGKLLEAEAKAGVPKLQADAIKAIFDYRVSKGESKQGAAEFLQTMAGHGQEAIEKATGLKMDMNSGKYVIPDDLDPTDLTDPLAGGSLLKPDTRGEAPLRRPEPVPLTEEKAMDLQAELRKSALEEVLPKTSAQEPPQPSQMDKVAAVRDAAQKFVEDLDKAMGKAPAAKPEEQPASFFISREGEITRLGTQPEAGRRILEKVGGAIVKATPDGVIHTQAGDIRLAEKYKGIVEQAVKREPRQETMHAIVSDRGEIKEFAPKREGLRQLGKDEGYAEIERPSGRVKLTNEHTFSLISGEAWQKTVAPKVSKRFTEVKPERNPVGRPGTRPVVQGEIVPTPPSGNRLPSATRLEMELPSSQGETTVEPIKAAKKATPVQQDMFTVVERIAKGLEKGEKTDPALLKQVEEITGIKTLERGSGDVASDLQKWVNRKRGVAKRQATKEAAGGNTEHSAKIVLNPLSPILDAYTQYLGKPMWGLVEAAWDRAQPEYVKRYITKARYRQDPRYIEKAKARIGTVDYSAGLGRRVGSTLSKGIDQETQLDLGDMLAGKITEAEFKLLHSDPGLAEAIDAVKLGRLELDYLGGMSVTQGLLRSEQFFKEFGKYVPRMYRVHELPYDRMLQQYGEKKPTRIDLQRFKHRQDIPEFVRLMAVEEGGMGQIQEPAYVLAKAIPQLTHAVETAKLFNDVSKEGGWFYPDHESLLADGKKISDYTLMPDVKSLGPLRGGFVEKYIADDINAIVRGRNEFQKVTSALISEWKYNKVVANPATHVRNIISNVILNYLNGLNPFSPSGVSAYWKAMNEFRKSGEYFIEARDNGLVSDSFERGELGDYLDSWDKTNGGVFSRLTESRRLFIEGQYGKAANKMRPSTTAIGQKLARLYSMEEGVFKLAKYIHNREQYKMSAKDAAADAEKTLFDYTEVSPFIDIVRKSPIGAPFITFTYKALPLILETAVKYPWRIGAIWFLLSSAQKYALSKMGIDSPQKEEEFMRPLAPRFKKSVAGIPNQMLLPWKDRYGQLQFYDLTYTLPWGDMADTGSLGFVPFMSSPVKAFYEVMPGINKNQFTNRPIYLESDTATEKSQKAAAHLWRTWAPSLAPGGYGFEKLNAARQGKSDSVGRVNTKLGAFTSAVLGFKVNPVDPELEGQFRIREFKAMQDELGKDRMRIIRNQALSEEQRDRELQNNQTKIEKLSEKFEKDGNVQ